MVKKEPKTIMTTGKRKDSKARAKIESGKGRVSINSVPLEIWGTAMSRMRVKEALVLAGDVAKKVDIYVTSIGGGVMGQADAIRMSIARSLVDFSKSLDLRKRYVEYDKSILAFDFRRNEPHHGHGASKRGSRRHKQRSKR
jgi:small subunit ribosomal protein S9